MNLRSFAMAGLCAAALAAFPIRAQRDFSRVEIKVTKLSDTVYVLQGSGGNIGLCIGEDAVFLIDDQYAPLTEKIVAAVAKLTPRPVGFILNTHWHPDHTGGNANLGSAGAVIVAHENVRKRLSADQFVEAWRTTFPALPKAGLPVITFAARRSAPSTSRARIPTATRSCISSRATWSTWATCTGPACIPSSTPAAAAPSTA